MPAEIVQLGSRMPMLFGHEFICDGCSAAVWSAVHIGHRRLCYMCQHVDPHVRDFLRDRAE